MRTNRSALDVALGLGIAATTLGFAGCDDRQVAVFSVAGRPDNTTVLGVYSRVNGGTYTPGAAMQNLDEFGVEVPIDTTGTLDTQAFAYRSDAPCSIGNGSASVDLPGKYRQNQTLTLTATPGACTAAAEPADFPTKKMAVWAAAPNQMWLVGDGGKVLHWNGSYYTKIALPPILAQTPPDWNGVFGWSDDDVWIVGTNHAVAHFANGALTNVSVTYNGGTSTATDWQAITGGDPKQKDLILVGTNSVYGYLTPGMTSITQFLNSRCYQAPGVTYVPTASNHYNAVSCFVTGTTPQYYYDCWAAGDSGAVFRFLSVGAYSCQIPQVAPSTTEDLLGIWAAANLPANRFEVRVVGKTGTVFRGTGPFDSMTLQEVNFGGPADYNAYLPAGMANVDLGGISGTGFDNVWIASSSGNLLRWMDTDPAASAPQPFVLTQTGISKALSSVLVTSKGVLASGPNKALTYSGSLF